MPASGGTYPKNEGRSRHPERDLPERQPTVSATIIPRKPVIRKRPVSVGELRYLLAVLREAAAGGDPTAVALRDDVEDLLIEALAQRRRRIESRAM